MKFPKRIAITVDENSDGPVAEKLLAWASIDKADEGHVAIYELVDELETRSVTEKRLEAECVPSEVSMVCR